MEALKDEEYKKEYDKAMAELDSAGTEKEPIPEDKEVKAETTEEQPAEVKTEQDEKPQEDTQEEAKPAKTVEELEKELKIAEKRFKDTQAWGSKNAARLAELEKERLIAERNKTRPEILDANPELEAAIKYVSNDPTQDIAKQEADAERIAMIEAAHPGIFAQDLDPELVTAVEKRLSELGDDINNPLAVIREITQVKLDLTEQKIAKRFAIESEKQAKKSAMSIPSQGGATNRTPVDKDLAEAQRIANMSDAEFAKEVRRVKGF